MGWGRGDPEPAPEDVGVAPEIYDKEVAHGPKSMTDRTWCWPNHLQPNHLSDLSGGMAPI